MVASGDCPVCKGSGVMDLPRVPSASGGWLPDRYPSSGMECGACGGSGRRRYSGREPMEMPWSSADEPPPEPPSAEEQLTEVVDDLKRAFRHSDFFPDVVTGYWSEILDGLDVWSPDAGRLAVARLKRDWEMERERYRPLRDVFSMSVSNEMAFDAECRRIDRGLDFLDRLMGHASKILRLTPGLRRR